MRRFDLPRHVRPLQYAHIIAPLHNVHRAHAVKVEQVVEHDIPIVRDGNRVALRMHEIVNRPFVRFDCESWHEIQSAFRYVPDRQLARGIRRPEVGKRDESVGTEQAGDRGGVAAGHLHGRQLETQLEAVGLVVAPDVASVHVLALAAGLLAEDRDLYVSYQILYSVTSWH